MEYSDKWLGKLGGGLGASVVAGFSVCQAEVWSMAGGRVPMRVLITGKRLGLTANAEAGHYIVLVTGVRSPSCFHEIKSKGVDWVLTIGGKADAVVKSTGKLGRALWSASKSAGNWAAQESAKKAVQGAMGDFNLPTKEPGFILLPTPLATGLGAGLYYEWQTLVKLGDDIAWEYVKPNWWLEVNQRNVLLHMDSIPEQDDVTIPLQITQKVFGPDNILRFSNRINGPLTTVIRANVKRGRLYDTNGTMGVVLSDRQIGGVTEIGMLTVSRKTRDFSGKTIDIAINVARSDSGTNLYKWSSREYAKVTINQHGLMESSPDHLRFKK